MNLTKVVVIIPTYNEAPVIADTIAAIFKTAVAINKELHVLVFDSCSTDSTQRIVLDLQATYPKLHLQTEPHKTGLGSAYLQAMHYAINELKAEIIVEFDADLSHQPKYLPPILEQLNTCDAVVGSRYVKGGTIPKDWGIDRKILSKLGNVVARLILTPRYKDFTSGFRATRHIALNKALPDQFISNNYAYKIELLWNLHQNKRQNHRVSYYFPRTRKRV